MKTHSIEEQLLYQLVRIIRKRCTDCNEFTTAYIRQGLFLCHGNPTKTTYRSTIVSPFSNVTATELVGIIQNWVSNSPSLIIDKLLVRVNANCLTRIDCLDSDECISSADEYDPAVIQRISQVLSVCAVRELGQQICTI